MNLNLKEPPLEMKYVYHLLWGKYIDNSKRTDKLTFNYMKHNMTVSNSFVVQFCSERMFDSNTMILIDEDILRQYPQLSSKDER